MRNLIIPLNISSFQGSTFSMALIRVGELFPFLLIINFNVPRCTLQQRTPSLSHTRTHTYSNFYLNIKPFLTEAAINLTVLVKYSLSKICLSLFPKFLVLNLNYKNFTLNYLIWKLIDSILHLWLIENYQT